MKTCGKTQKLIQHEKKLSCIIKNTLIINIFFLLFRISFYFKKSQLWWHIRTPKSFTFHIVSFFHAFWLWMRTTDRSIKRVLISFTPKRDIYSFLIQMEDGGSSSSIWKCTISNNLLCDDKNQGPTARGSEFEKWLNFTLSSRALCIVFFLCVPAHLWSS